ncbi:MAG: hypothetical protein FWD13_01360 [Treponema sp.]|nr:hypothetical protein [Treponema sp.]
MKKVIVILLISVLVIGLVSCGGGGGGKKESRGESASEAEDFVEDPVYNGLIDEFEVIVKQYVELKDAGNMNAAWALQDDNAALYDRLWGAKVENKLSEEQNLKFADLMYDYPLY